MSEVDPCLDADVCDQACVHSNGSFTCECCHGYVNGSESGRCLAAGEILHCCDLRFNSILRAKMINIITGFPRVRV